MQWMRIPFSRVIGQCLGWLTFMANNSNECIVVRHCSFLLSNCEISLQIPLFFYFLVSVTLQSSLNIPCINVLICREMQTFPPCLWVESLLFECYYKNIWISTFCMNLHWSFGVVDFDFNVIWKRNVSIKYIVNLSFYAFFKIANIHIYI